MFKYLFNKFMVKLGNKQINNKKVIKIINAFFLNYFNYVIIGIVILSFSFGYLFFIRPRYIDISESIKTYNETKKEEYNDLNIYLSKLNKYKSAYESITDKDKERISIMLPENINQEDLFTEMESLISSMGYILTSIQISGDKGQAGKSRSTRSNPATVDVNQNIDDHGLIGEIRMSLNISGATDYDSVKKLLTNLENNLRIMDIESLGFSFEGSSVSLVVKTYYLKSI